MMTRLRTPSLKVRQNAEQTPVQNPTPKGKVGRPKGSKRRGRKPKRNPWEDEEDTEVHYGYQSRSDDEEAEDEDDKTVEISDLVEEAVSDEEVDIKCELLSEQNDTVSFLPWVELNPEQMPVLELPETSADIPLHPDHILDSLEIYEILRCYNRSLKLSPFTFENFCAAMSSPENSCLLAEIHMSLLKVCLRVDDEEQIHYSVNDTNNAFNIMVYSMDSMTYGEILRQYLESDRNRHRVPIEIINAIREPNYPFVDISIRTAIITFLCYRFLDSLEYKKLINHGGKLPHDENCRSCGKGGHLLSCDTCEAAFHLNCTSLTEKPESWSCALCKLNEVHGVTDCLPIDHAKERQPFRMIPLGRDRHERLYWFVARRVFVQDDAESVLFYYSTAPQIYELFKQLDPHYYEYDLCKVFCEQLQEIMEQMAVTLELSIEARNHMLKTTRDRRVPDLYIHFDNLNRMKKIVTEVKTEQSVKKEEDDESQYQPLPNRILPMLGINEGSLFNTFWSGCLEENDVLNHVPVELDPIRLFRMGSQVEDDSYKQYKNHYGNHEHADSSATRKKTLDRKKYLSTRFSVNDEGDYMFQWSMARGKDMYGNDRLQAKYIEWTLAKMIKKIPPEMFHRRWKQQAGNYDFFLKSADNHEKLAQAVLRAECCMRRTLFHPQFWNSLGHTRLHRTTTEEREHQTKELQKQKKEERDISLAEEDDEVIKVKYTRLPSKACPQALWRQRGETYRVAGRGALGGWEWISMGLSWKNTGKPEPLNLDDLKSDTLTPAVKKAKRLSSIADKLLGWRVEEEKVKVRKFNNDCYSPSCRLGIPSRSICEELPEAGLQSCYSQACRTKPRVDESEAILTPTQEVVKAHDVHKTPTQTAPLNPDDDRLWPLIKPNEFNYKTTKKNSILVVHSEILRRLAVSSGKRIIYVPNFSLNAKGNSSVWNYPCLRPCFDLCWRYLLTNAYSLHAVALQLKILWYCIKWSELEPSDEEADDGRVIHHYPDRDDLRKIIDHRELPPFGTYERYNLAIESVYLEDEGGDNDEDWNDRSERRGGRSSSRLKKPTSRVATRRVRHTKTQWVDGVDLKVFEIKNYWNMFENRKKSTAKTTKILSAQELLSQQLAKQKTIERKQQQQTQQQQQQQMRSTPRPMHPARPLPPHQTMYTPRPSNSYSIPPALSYTPTNPNNRKRPYMETPYRGDNYDYQDVEFEDWSSTPSSNKPYGVPPNHKRTYFSNLDSPAPLSPNRRTSHGYEYSGGAIRGGGRYNDPVGDGMRRVTTISGPPGHVGAEEVVTTSNQRVMRATGGAEVEHPPNITRGYDDQSYNSPVISSRQVQRPGGPAVQNAQSKVLMIRRADGTTQFLRPVNGANGSAAGIQRPVMAGNPGPSNSVEIVNGGFARRVVTTAQRPRGVAVMRPGDPPGKMLRVSSAQMDDPFVRRMRIEKPPGALPPQHVSYVDQTGRPVMRPQARIPTVKYESVAEPSNSAFSLGRPVQIRPMTMREPIQDGFRPSAQVPRRITSYQEFLIKRGVDNMRLPSRPYRFEFESNEDEERAIAEAIAREEELMRQEEESKRGHRGENHWQHPRIIDRFGQVGTHFLSQLSKQPLTISSNLLTTSEDTPDQKVCKQVLDSIVTQVCKWDKQHGWYKSHLKRPRNRMELDKFRSRRMFSNQREVILMQHVEKLRKEINKRRTAMENQAEEECGLLTPWRKAKGRGQKAKRAASQDKDNSGHRPVVNPAEISLGGDAVKWDEEAYNKKEEDVDELVEEQSPRRSTRNASRWSPGVNISSPKRDKLRKVKDEISSADEAAGTSASPRKRGRPPKRPYDETVEEAVSDDSDNDKKKKRVRRPAPPGMDEKELHCICRKRYNPYKFYLACSSCENWFHGKCVGISEEKAEKLNAWHCPNCEENQVDVGPQLYCTCRTEYDESQFYVGCDGCQGWFHPNCVGITRSQAESMEEYMCPECTRTTMEQQEEEVEMEGYDSADSGDSSNQPVLCRTDYPLIWKLLDQLMENPMSFPFKQPFDPNLYPNVVNMPSSNDLSIIQRKLENLEYHTLKNFADDVRNMLINAKTYFEKGSDICMYAEALEHFFETHFVDIQFEIENRARQDRRKASECRTIDSSLDIDTDQLIDVAVDPAMYEHLL